MEGYEAKVKESSMNLSKKDMVKLSLTDDFIPLDDELKDTESKLEIEVVGYTVLQIHNEKADDKDYEKYLIHDKNGNIYSTGSAPFFTTFFNIFNEMSDSNEEWKLLVFKRESKNYKGKNFITCTIS